MRSPLFGLCVTGADLLDDRVRNQDSGSEALDQIEAAIRENRMSGEASMTHASLTMDLVL